MRFITLIQDHWGELLAVLGGLVALYYLSRGIGSFERKRHEKGYDFNGFWNYYRSRWGGQPMLTSALTPKMYILSKVLAIYILDLMRRAGLHNSYIPELIGVGWLVMYIMFVVFREKVNAPKISWRPSEWFRQIRTPDSLA